MKNEKRSNKCNICGCPRLVEFTEIDKETGKTETKSHFIPCLGHPYIKPHLWNHHSEYDKYRMLRTKQRKTSRGQDE